MKWLQPTVRGLRPLWTAQSSTLRALHSSRLLANQDSSSSSSSSSSSPQNQQSLPSSSQAPPPSVNSRLFDAPPASSSSHTSDLMDVVFNNTDRSKSTSFLRGSNSPDYKNSNNTSSTYFDAGVSGSSASSSSTSAAAAAAADAASRNGASAAELAHGISYLDTAANSPYNLYNGYPSSSSSSSPAAVSAAATSAGQGGVGPNSAPLRTVPSLGRTVHVSNRIDPSQALRILNSQCRQNQFSRKLFLARAHERPGLRRKRLKSERWRARFRTGFTATVQRVQELVRQGW